MFSLFTFAIVLIGLALSALIIGVPSFLFALGTIPILIVYALILASIFWALRIHPIVGLLVFVAWLLVSYIFQRKIKGLKFFSDTKD